MMTYAIPEDLLQKYSVRIAYLAPATPPIAREAVIGWVIQFEYSFQRYMLATLKRINPEISDGEFSKGGIFTEPNMLSSLSKCLRLSKLLAMVSLDEHHDIKKVIDIRNMYAHGRARVEFRDDADAKATMHEMKIYRNNKVRLDALDPGRAFGCCVEFLSRRIDEKIQIAERGD